MQRRLLVICWICLLLGQTAAADDAAGRKLTINDNWDLVVDAFHRTPENTILFKFSIKNKGASAGALDWIGRYEITGVKFMDLGGRKMYYCMEAGSSCLGSRSGFGELAPGASRQFWMHVTAPPAHVKELTLLLADLPPIGSLPIDPVPAN